MLFQPLQVLSEPRKAMVEPSTFQRRQGKQLPSPGEPSAVPCIIDGADNCTLPTGSLIKN